MGSVIPLDLAVSVRFMTIYRIGHWGRLTVRCRSEPDKWSTQTHHVHYYLTNKYGDQCPWGYFIFSQFQGPAVIDENGDAFTDLECAVWHHARQIMAVTERGPCEWSDKPPEGLA